MIRPTHHYIGRCSYCGTPLAAVYDMTDYPKETAEGVASMVRRQLRVERVPLGSVPFSPDGCACHEQASLGPLFAPPPTIHAAQPESAEAVTP